VLFSPQATACFSGGKDTVIATAAVSAASAYAIKVRPVIRLANRT
jgi:hypothetical protein